MDSLSKDLARDPVLVAISDRCRATSCWVAGGWVRDKAIRRRSPDLDLVVEGDFTAAEDAARRLARAFGVRAHLLGKPPRAVWRLQTESLGIEILPLGDLGPEGDAARRDFTCNAMLWRLPSGPLVDPCNGLNDIRTATVRAVSRGNLVADPVRLLRGPRFVASLPGFTMDRQTRAWIGDLSPRLETAPKERVGAELQTMAAAPLAGAGFMLAHDAGLLTAIAPRQSYRPDLTALARLTQLSPHPVPAAARAAGGDAILAWLASAWGLSSARPLMPFAWDRSTVRRIVRAVSCLDEAAGISALAAPARRQVIARAAESFPIVVSLAAASDPHADAHALLWRRWWRQWRRSGAVILGLRPPLHAEEISDIAGLRPGPDLGRVIESLQSAVVRGEIRSASGARRWLRAQFP